MCWTPEAPTWLLHNLATSRQLSVKHLATSWSESGRYHLAMNIQELSTTQLTFDNLNKLAQLDYAIRWEECLGYSAPISLALDADGRKGSCGSSFTSFRLEGLFFQNKNEVAPVTPCA